MTELSDRLRRVGAERQRTTAHDIPGHYLRVVAQISQADGKLMIEAAEKIEQLQKLVTEYALNDLMKTDGDLL